MKLTELVRGVVLARLNHKLPIIKQMPSVGAQQHTNFLRNIERAELKERGGRRQYRRANCKGYAMKAAG